jgi:hypothetical protein
LDTSLCGEGIYPRWAAGAGEACDLLNRRLELKCQGKDRSLASLDSSYTANTGLLRRSSNVAWALRGFWLPVGVLRI